MAGRAGVVITAQRLTTNRRDQDALVPLLDATVAVLGRTRREVSADAGFCREVYRAALAARRIRGCLAPGRADPSGRRRSSR
jgi:hypothetical protein